MFQGPGEEDGVVDNLLRQKLRSFHVLGSRGGGGVVDNLLKKPDYSMFQDPGEEGVVVDNLLRQELRSFHVSGSRGGRWGCRQSPVT